MRSTSGTAAAAAATAATASTQAAQTAASQAITRLNASLKSMRDAQAAARAAAQAAAGTVPNGLGAGGLVVAPGAVPSATDGGAGLWQGANLPTQTTTSGGRTQVEVKQTESKAILTWESFNVGRETDLYFNQTAGGSNVANWIALNRVLDPTAAPSKILGTIKAEGQVYVINQNGIIFGGTSQVNVGALVVSSLSLSNAQFMAGINTQLYILNDPSGSSIAMPQFGYLGQESPNQYVSLTDPSQVAGAVIGDAPGDVVVEAGAQLSIASGGKALLFAPHVVNSGQITAPDGQVIMAAGEQVYLTTSLTDVRGLDVAVSAPMRWVFDYYHMATATGQGNWVDPGNPYQADLTSIVFPEMAERAATVGYSVINNGIVEADHGNITLMSREIVQNGALLATTALNNQDGSISLRAFGDGMMSYGSSMSGSPLKYWSTGTLTLGTGSVTAVTPDLTDTSEIELSSLSTRYSPGSVELRGYFIDIEAQANVLVPAGTITIVASALADAGETPISGETSIRDGSRVYIGEDAYLSVAGLQDIVLAMSSNIVTAELRINELRDSPLYKDSWLTGLTVYVDKRESGTFADGVMAGVDWVDGEPGAWVGTPLADVSAWIGIGKTTLGELSTTAGSITIKSGGSIITRAGSMLDVSGGSVRYEGGWVNTTKLLGADGKIYDISEATPDRVYVGLAGDTVVSHARAGVTETYTNKLRRSSGHYEAGYTEGRDAGTIQLFAAEAMVLEGSYSGGVVTGERQAASGEVATAGTLKIGGLSDEHRQWLLGNLIITSDPVLLPDDFTATTALDSLWYGGSAGDDESFRKKTTYLDSDVLAASGMGKLEFYVATSFTLAQGETLELAPGTSLSVIANVSSLYPASFTVDGSIRIAGGDVRFAGATASYGAGAVIDVSGLWVNGASTIKPVIDGGTIQVTGSFADGVVLDVSGGGWYDTTGGTPELTVGDAGTITLTVEDPGQVAGLDLRGYAAGSGGTLLLTTTGNVLIGGAASIDPTALHLSETLFGDRGFRALTLTTTGDVTVADGATVTQVPVSLDVWSIDLAGIASGATLAEVAPTRVLSQVQRLTLQPTSLALVGADVTVGTGAVLRTDIGGSISLASAGTIDPGTGSTIPGDVIVRGTIDAPAGSISLSAGDEIRLAAAGQLLARGVAAIETDHQGLRSGNVLDGGTVSLSNAAVITLESGSLVDVSGTSGETDVAVGRNVTTTAVSSNGGTISLAMSGAANDLIDGTFLGYAGGAGAIGGTIDITVGTVTEATSRVTLPATLYYIDRNTGVITSFNATRNLDLYQEYSSGSETAYRYSVIRSAVYNGTAALKIGGGLAIVDLDADSTPSTLASPLATRMTSYANQLALLETYFYTDAAATQRLVLPTVQLKVTKISADTVNNGGFANLSVNSTAFMVAPGIDLSFGKSITVNGTLASGGAGTASMTAPYVALLSGSGSAGAAGTGNLVITADLIDITQAAFEGFAATQLVADEIRMGGLLTDLTTNRTSTLTVDGRLTLTAGVVYPATGILATITAGTELVIEPNGDAPLPLSAAGSLSLVAPVIVQNGVLRAPFGSITLTATDSIMLGAGSITSVSGDGLVALYGTLINDELWADPVTKATTDDPTPSLSELPEKTITLSAPKVTLASGSVVDIRGGGDLYAWESVVGSGGSHDVLAQAGMYAILPASTYATGSQSRVWLAGGNGIAAGWYVLMPARYALLPGAYAVSMVAGSSGQAISDTTVLADGTILMSGYRAETYGGGYDQLTATWRIMSGSVVRSYSEYNEAFANTYFASDAFKLVQYRLTGVDIVTPLLPMDGGSVVFKASTELVLDGTLLSQPVEGGRGGLVDIAGTKIAIVGAGQDTSDLAGYLVIDSAALGSFGAGSVLIGGSRSNDAQGLLIDVSASDVVVRNDATSALTGAEIVIAASGTITVADGSVIRAEGDASASVGNLVMAPQVKAVYGDLSGVNDGNPDNDVLLSASKDYGALIRVSNGSAVKVLRENVDTTIGGVVSIGAGATLAGGKALLIDATGTTTVDATAKLSGTALSLASGRIGFGVGASGLVLDAASLAQLANTSALTLRSYSTIDFYDSIDLGGAGLSNVALDAAGLVGYGTATIAVTGGTIALENSGGSFVEPTGAGHAQLALNADEIVLGAGSKALRGFDAVTLTASQQIVGEGTGAIDAGDATVVLAAPLLTGRGGAAQSLVTTGALQLVGGGGPADDSGSSLGVRLALTASSIDVRGRIVALGGAVDLTSTGGDVTIGSGASIDVGGYEKQFYDVAEFADAGNITLTAVGGSVMLAANSVLDLSADAGGGNAGTLTLAASGGGTVVMNGLIAAQAGAGGVGGSFALDIASLPDFAGMSQALNAAGFTASRQFRIRSGNVVVDGVTTVADFQLVADQGSVTLAGTIDARSDYGGTISISAGDGLTMLSSAVLQAGATGDYGSGRVTLEASGGVLDVQGGRIDVAGGDGGSVRFRALQSADHTEIAVANLQATIVGARSAVLEGVSVYDSNSVDAVRAGAVADANTFTGNAAAIAARLNATGSVDVMPGIEIRSSGDLVAETDWNLAADFGADAREGTLTLRAAGNLTILGNISDGFSTADSSGVLQDTASWSLRLVAGADLTSASATALTPLAGLATGSGSLIVGDSTHGNLIRTGTGDIAIAAGRDLALANSASAIYTAGRADADLEGFTAAAGATYGIDGGNLTIVAQGNASAALPADLHDSQLFTEWLKRQGETDSSYVFLAGQQSSWWVDYGAFAQGVGALGGGNVSVTTGGDLTNMLVALPTNGRVTGGLTADVAKTLVVRNGGLMTVDVGGAVAAGYYYVGRGAGVITAGELAVGRDVTIVRTSTLTEVYAIAPVIALGDATMSVRTAGDLVLQTVLDPLLLGDGDYHHGAYMSGYTDRTALSLTSVGGDVTLVNQGQFLSKDLDLSAYVNGGIDGDVPYALLGQLAVNLYPSITRITALNGSVTNEARFWTMPGSSSELRILASDDVLLGSIVMSRATQEMIPSAFMPLGGSASAIQIDMQLDVVGSTAFQNQAFQLILLNDINIETYYGASTHNSYLASVRNPTELANADDYEASRVYALDGSIVGTTVWTKGLLTLGTVTTNEQTWFRAGTDIRNIDYNLRNLHTTDVSLLESGNDIIGGTIVIHGPGAIVLAAGRDVYGSSFTIDSRGNRDYNGSNRPVDTSEILGLPREGAAITVMAGLGDQQPSYAAFAAAYLDPANTAAMASYLTTTVDGVLLPIYLVDAYETVDGVSRQVRTGIVSFVADITGETLSPLAAWARFQTLPSLVQQRFLRQVYMQELAAAGADQTTLGSDGQPLNGGYNRGYAAIAVLFPGDDWSGNVAIGNATFRTMAGGGIDVLAPGGGLQVAALGTVAPSGSGLITLGSGDITVFTRDDVIVNQSRVLTFAGGDEVIWSTLGDIDAGRGAKTTRVPAAPEIVTDADAVTEVLERADISGSGIGTIIGFTGVEPGDVTLIAPQGTVNAGDAGIRVSGDFTVAARFVLNMDNVKVTGETKGVPKEDTKVAPLTVETKDKTAAEAAAAATQQATGDRPSVIIVEILGYGGGGEERQPDENGSEERRRDRRSGPAPVYDPAGPVQIIGVGPLTEEERLRLRAEERGRL